MYFWMTVNSFIKIGCKYVYAHLSIKAYSILFVIFRHTFTHSNYMHKKLLNLKIFDKKHNDIKLSTFSLKNLNNLICNQLKSIMESSK